MTPIQTRQAMSSAFATYLMAKRSLMAANARWRMESAGLVDVINQYEDSKVRARQLDSGFDDRPTDRQRDLVGHQCWDAGIAALDACREFHDRRDALADKVFKAHSAALRAMGFHFGSQMALFMANQRGGDFGATYWRFARQMAKAMRSCWPNSRVLGLAEDFASTAGFSAALGIKRPKDLIKMVYSGNCAGDTCRIC